MSYDAELIELIDLLSKEQPEKQMPELSALSTLEKWEVFRGLCNERAPKSVSKDFLEKQDAFLQAWNREASLVTLNRMTLRAPQIYLWQGDITRLKVDGIVNAANSTLLGCTQANHHCIDNIIHTKAGVQLRLACDKLIQAQKHKEPTGKAKITEAYNLPAKYVLHTVGPFIDQRGVTPLRAKLLADSYRACLKLADKYQLETIAFCCISTGEFNFPNQHAAEIAINTVTTYLSEAKSKLNVIFNVFKDEDKVIYEKLLNEGV